MKKSKLKEPIDSYEAIGTSFYDDEVKTTVKLLKKILGKPTLQNNNGDDKTNFEWIRKTVNGDVFTVYDWKEYRKISQSEEIEFHIGAKNERVSAQATIEIKLALADL